MVTPWILDRGDVLWLNFHSQRGHEQAGRRPALVLSPKSYNARTGLAIVCPVTSKVKGNPFEVRVPQGLPVSGVILADHVKSLDWQERTPAFICRVSKSVTTAVVQTISYLLLQA